jgi:hypothetical protein
MKNTKKNLILLVVIGILVFWLQALAQVIQNIRGRGQLQTNVSNHEKLTR